MRRYGERGISVFVCCVVTLLRGDGSREQGTDGFFVLREVAPDEEQIEGAKDARVRFAIK
jgi:hypothetical protein